MDSSFSYTSPRLLPVLADLLAREPIFHQPQIANTAEEFADMLAPSYWEVGASGRRYSRSFILSHLAQHPPASARKAGWQITEPACQQIGPDTFLFTYTLHQGDRISRRSTLWRRRTESWEALYHQGTLSTTAVDDVAPEPPSVS